MFWYNHHMDSISFKEQHFYLSVFSLGGGMGVKISGPVENQRTNGPVNAHLISWPSKAQNI